MELIGEQRVRASEVPGGIPPVGLSSDCTSGKEDNCAKSMWNAVTRHPPQVLWLLQEMDVPTVASDLTKQTLLLFGAVSNIKCGAD